METTLIWNGGLNFTTYFHRMEGATGAWDVTGATRVIPDGFVGGALTVAMDAKPPMGRHSAPTPKEVVLAGLLGCSAMDVVSLLKKWNEGFTSYEMHGTATQTKDYPMVFERVEIEYRLRGTASIEKIREAVHLSQTKYCGVSAMIAKSAEIVYRIYLNDAEIGEGSANF